MIHPDTELRFVSDTVGYGVFATAFIPRGTILWVLDYFDRILSPAEVRALPAAPRAVVERYSYVDPDGSYVFCWDFGRYMNHSCDPTTRSVGQAFEVTVRDVHPGDHLTCEYGVLNIGGSFECACGSANCRGSVSPADLDAHAERWDREAKEAFALVGRVAQPLLPYAKLSDADAALLADALSGRQAAIPSVLAYRSEVQTHVTEGGGLWGLK